MEEESSIEATDKASRDHDWSTLPTEALVHIFTFLSLRDRCSAACTCNRFYHVSNTPSLWSSLRLCFFDILDPPTKEDIETYTLAIQRHGPHVRRLWVTLDQSHPCNRQRALSLISLVHNLPDKMIKHFRLTFTGENQFFYNGREFVEALMLMLGPTSHTSLNAHPPTSSLLHLDLSQASIALDDKFVDVISEYNPNLQTLNIHTYPTNFCKVTPQAVLRLLQRCGHLKTLAVCKVSVSEEVIKALLEPRNETLEKLVLRYTIEDNTSNLMVLTETWLEIKTKLKSLKVDLIFDAECTYEVIIDYHMDANIPVSSIEMETSAFIYCDIAEKITSRYCETLEKLVLMTSVKPFDVTLSRCLKHVAASCPLLTSLIVYSIIIEHDISSILKLRPNIDKKISLLESKPWEIGEEMEIVESDVW